MSRFRVTVRGGGIELRGYIDGPTTLVDFANALQEKYGDSVMVIASQADDNYNPFGLQQEGGAVGGF